MPPRHTTPVPGLRSGATAPRRRWWILGVLSTAQLMVVLDGTIMNIALPSAQADLGFPDGRRQWVVTSYALAFGSLLLLGGRVADLFGRRATFLVGLAGFAGTSALAGMADGFGMLVGARAGQGLSSALLAPAALSLVGITFTDAKERATAFGVWGAAAGAGGAVGMPLGGVLTEYLSWRWAMYMNTLAAVLAFAAGILLLAPAPRARTSRLDVPGTVLVGSGLFCLVYGFAAAENHPWSSVATWGFLAAAAALLVAFTWWQTRAAHPLLPLHIVLDRDRGASLIALFQASSAVFGTFLFATYYLQHSLGYGPAATGLAYLPMIGGLIGTSPLATNVLLPRFGPKTVIAAGAASAAGGLALLATLGLDSAYATAVLPALVLTGAGLGTIITATTSLATLGVAAADSGVASATVNAMQYVGGSIGVALLNTVSTTTTASYLADHDTPGALTRAHAALAGYHAAFRWLAAAFVVCLFVAVPLYRRRGAARQVNRAAERSTEAA
ncbi:ABC transporter [Streptomyces albireticuli]|uniref:ABC transporter n=1 Tax=Streptomyces albireticuli TaxID=1940 RepID=A0A1Z2LCZ4_9ACTN|nr:MFS transporter [Streptomyces albireticuli]ARZ72177.1 ABC transporter [Streptomyces albireticuli]